MLKINQKDANQLNNSVGRSLQLFQLDWLGQMTASILWAASVFAYGINSTADLLQLCAAIAWMVANIASFKRTLSKENPYLRSKEITSDPDS